MKTGLDLVGLLPNLIAVQMLGASIELSILGATSGDDWTCQ